jgi:ring-1,2-phenylacetyl-CoA epoxidase subunit PaaC
VTVSGTTPLDAATRDALAELLLSVADDEFVIGFWDSEWTGIAPMLEEDVATSSIAQDELGHAAALYGLLAELTDDDPDRIAFGRAPDAYRHAALLNHARGDWAFSVARRWLYETADAVRLNALSRSSWQPLADLAAKMRREETYHRMHLDTWLDRLAGSDPEVRARLVEALRRLWPDAHTVFAPLTGEQTLILAGILPESMSMLRADWAAQAATAFARHGIELDAVDEVDPGGRMRRTDDFAWLHGEFTMVARSEVGATW